MHTITPNYKGMLKRYIKDYLRTNDTEFLIIAKSLIELLAKYPGKNDLRNNIILNKVSHNNIIYISLIYDGKRLCDYKSTLEISEIFYNK